MKPFFRGMNRNSSIQQLSLKEMNLFGGEIFQSLRPFFEKNNRISEIEVGQCRFGAGCAHQLSVALRGLHRSLQSVCIQNNNLGGERLEEIIEALSVHPQLEKLELVGINIEKNWCMQLVGLLRGWSFTELQELNLSNSGKASTPANSNSNLRTLDLAFNSITVSICQGLAALLSNPNSNFEELHLSYNNIGDEGARIFAQALARNESSKLKTLGLHYSIITAEAWSCFSKVLCDTSSVNRTFLSNHTLRSLGYEHIPRHERPPSIEPFLELNRSSEDKKHVAIKKILLYHDHFDMQPFFEWDFKVLPIAINWFERAGSIDFNDVVGIYRRKLGRRKLESIYQFIRAMPEVFEPASASAGEKRK